MYDFDAVAPLKIPFLFQTSEIFRLDRDFTSHCRRIGIFYLGFKRVRFIEPVFQLHSNESFIFEIWTQDLDTETLCFSFSAADE